MFSFHLCYTNILCQMNKSVIFGLHLAIARSRAQPGEREGGKPPFLLHWGARFRYFLATKLVLVQMIES